MQAKGTSGLMYGGGCQSKSQFSGMNFNSLHVFGFVAITAAIR
jgi:hypothetical protein